MQEHRARLLHYSSLSLMFDLILLAWKAHSLNLFFPHGTFKSLICLRRDGCRSEVIHEKCDILIFLSLSETWCISENKSINLIKHPDLGRAGFFFFQSHISVLFPTDNPCKVFSCAHLFPPFFSPLTPLCWYGSFSTFL